MSDTLGNDDFDPAMAAQLNRAYERGLRGEGGLSIEEARKLLLGDRPDSTDSSAEEPTDFDDATAALLNESLA